MKKTIPMSLFLAATACGSLSKEDAETVILTEVYGDDDGRAATCTTQYLGAEGSGKDLHYKPHETDLGCARALVSAGLLRPAKCVPAGDVCQKTFVLGADAKNSNGQVKFKCGGKMMGDVLSVTTEDRRATVKYDRTLVPDSNLLDSLGACKISKGTAGKSEFTAVLLKDDDGEWHFEKMQD